MGKRSRRERRERQAQRAIAAHDPAAIRALADRSPELAAQQLTAALGAMAPEDAGSPVVESAIALAGRLRRSGQLRAARRLAAAGAGRSARLRLEQALAAFALGDDAEAAQLASGDPEVRAVVGPLVGAARGVAPEPPGTASSAGLRALHAAAAAVSAAVRGELAAGRALLKRVAPAQRKVVLAAEIRAAIDVQEGADGRPLSAALPLLAGSSALRAVAGAHEALVLAASETNADLALDIGRRLQLDDGALQLARARAAARALATQAPPALTSGAGERTALGVAQRFGADVFDEQDRATACLYEGFACLAAEPERAARAFDRAIGLGGDLVEALRGRLKLALLQAGAVCAECGVRHDDRGAEAAAIADHLARALSRTPAAAPLAAAAALIAAEAWGAEGNLKAARASLDVGRAKASGTLARDADLIEARVLAEAQPERALGLVEKVLADRPEDVDAWRLKIALAKRRGGREGVDAAIVQAAEATRDPALAAEAREVRGRRADLAPFAELAPAAATAGALAAELRRAARAARSQVSAIEARAAAHREALDPAAQLAFDAACVSLAAELDGSAAGRARLVEAVRAWWSSPPALMKLAAASWLFGVAGALVEAARQARGGAESAGALAALAEAALAAGDTPIAERLIALGAAAWPHSELARLRGLLGALRRRERRAARRGPASIDALGEPLPGLKAPRPDVAGEELDALLAPEFSLFDEAEGAAGVIADGDEGEPREGDVLLGLLSFLGLPPGVLDRLTADERRTIEARARKILAAGPSARSARELERLIERLLGDPEIPFPSGPSRARPRRSA
ncbi:uncharacterized protein SOCE26_044970 [Sorangium cellulosum]|uniref:Uncharacterized protein n=1 Tax=Sorangium cellulosum TaxID=56 RepID=A0A2L0EUT2_SORCE|nr:hypothetical protein [Sorangium cellulosum]AUX43057.1 uncharacterized protein SOCE26_044970 [Sorangium cellulosum]